MTATLYPADSALWHAEPEHIGAGHQHAWQRFGGLLQCSTCGATEIVDDPPAVKAFAKKTKVVGPGLYTRGGRRWEIVFEQALDMLIAGKRKAVIAQALGISQQTVRKYEQAAWDGGLL
jgi:hypothetical protein